MPRTKGLRSRKLAAILIADVVGYSRLTNQNESDTLSQFERNLKNYIRPAIRRFQGRLVKTMGDGVLAEFGSPVHAVQCAIAIQEGIIIQNTPLPIEQRMRFRIGINFGDVVLDGDDVLGGCVNVAARLQALAGPDEIYVTSSVVEHVRGKFSVLFEDQGERALKNIDEPVRVYRASHAKSSNPGAREHTRIPTIAVLPFLNLSGDPAQRYFSDGVTEDIMTELSRFRTISVIARTSSFSYRDKDLDVKRICDELKADFVVEGSVRVAEQRARITVQLISGDDQRHVWAEKYDIELSQIFSVQDQVTQSVAATVVPKIELHELEAARRRPTSHMRAYDCYLRGKAQYYAAADGRGLAEAKRFFQEALTHDPEFARPYCFLAAIDNNLTLYSAAGTSLSGLRESAREYAMKAAALDDSDPLSHLSLAWCHLWRREFDAARAQLAVATRLNPNDADRAMDRGTTLMYLGEPEAAIEVMLGAMALNPFHPPSYAQDLAEAFFVSHRYEEMIRAAEQISDRSPKFTAWMAAAYAYLGREKDASQQAANFVTKMREIWAGDAGATETDYILWILQFSPFQRREDVEHLLKGLRLAGLNGPTSLPAAR